MRIDFSTFKMSVRFVHLFTLKNVYIIRRFDCGEQRHLARGEVSMTPSSYQKIVFLK